MVVCEVRVPGNKAGKPILTLLKLSIPVLLFWSAFVGLMAQEPRYQADAIEDLANIDFRNDLRIFTVMAAANVGGFDHETPSHQWSVVRSSLRDKLSDLNRELRVELEGFFEKRSHLAPEELQAALTSLALLLDHPPGFSLLSEPAEVPAEARPVLGLELVLPRFYREAGLEGLWNLYQPLYKQELETYRPLLREIIGETLQYFRTPARIVLDRQLVLIPDLLSFHNVVNARNLERIYYVVVGPAGDPEINAEKLKHEYLHFLLDPLIQKYGGAFLKHRDLLELAHRQPALNDDLRNRFLLLVTESLIEAVQARMRASKRDDFDFQQEMVESFRKGLVFTPYFYRELEEYQDLQEVSLPVYLETLSQEVSADQIRADAEMVDSWEAKTKGDSRTGQIAKTEGEIREPAIKSPEPLQKAGDLLQAQRYEEAEVVLKELLRNNPDNGNAHFYLAQVRSQMGDPEGALVEYSLAAEASNVVPWARAWALLRIGKILAYQRDFEGARNHFLRVSDMQGDLKGAAEEAGRLLEQLPKPQ